MKTPRNILLARHQAAAPKLDALRCVVMAKLNNQETKKPSVPASLVASLLGGPNKLWQELVWPARRIWAGLAAVWIGIFAVNFSQRDPAPVMAAKSSSPQMMLTFRQQERLLAELTGPGEPSVAEPPKNKTTAPRPRSERDFEILAT
jgi:hypothetical protein